MGLWSIKYIFRLRLRRVIFNTYFFCNNQYYFSSNHQKVNRKQSDISTQFDVVGLKKGMPQSFN
jgi:hypothetical protein